MSVKKGMPQEIIDEVDIRKEEKDKPMKVTAIVENHQVKLPVPSEVRLEVDFKKGQQLRLEYNKKEGKLIYTL